MSQLDNFKQWLLSHRVINMSGTMTALGAARVPNEISELVRASLPLFLDISELQHHASKVIAAATGAEAGCVTASAAAGICVGVAACMTGSDRGAAEQLPDTRKLDKTRVIIQRGHVVNYGGSILQNVALTGARTVEIGTAIHSEGYQLHHALDGEAAAGLYVVSHHTVQSSQISLPEFIEGCHAANVPVIVDAASEYDLKTFIALGADLVLYSGHKFLGGATAGIIAGEADLVKACLIHQTSGLGRPMKVGKEGIVSVIAALLRWQELDHKALHQAEYRRSRLLLQRINEIEGLFAEESPDPTGNPITRIRVTVDPGYSAAPIARVADLLAQTSPAVIVRGHHVDLGFFELDPCNCSDEEATQALEQLVDVAKALKDVTPGEDELGLGPRFSSYDEAGLPVVDPTQVPWMFKRHKTVQDKPYAWPKEK